MRLTVAGLVLVVVTAACSPGDGAGSDDSTTTSSIATTTTVDVTTIEPDPGETAVVGVLEIPLSLNPIAPGGAGPSSTLIQRASLPGAWVYDAATWRVVPDLVVRIPSVEEGDVSVSGSRQDVTWTIDPDATWSDGVPVSGADFAFTLRATFGETACAGGSGSPSLFGIRIVEIGDKTITVEMPGPSATYETMFAAVLPSHATDEASVCSDNGVGWPSAGPFLVRSVDDERVRLVRNETYWRDAPGFAAVEFVSHADEASLAAAVAAGDVDVAVVTDGEIAAAADDDGVEVVTEPSGRLEHLAFDFRSGDGDATALLGVLEFRQGVARAIDLEALATEIGWLPVTGVTRTATPATPWDPYGYDPDEARRLIGVACDEVGLDCAATPPQLTLLATDFGMRAEVVDQVAADLEAVGVAVSEVQVASADISDRIASGEWDLAVLSLTQPPGAAATATWLFNALDVESGRDVYRYGGSGSIASNERSAFQLRLFAGQFGAAPDPERVLRLIGEVHALLAAEVVFVPLVASPRHTLIGDAIDGVVPNASPSGVTWNIGQWAPVEE